MFIHPTVGGKSGEKPRKFDTFTVRENIGWINGVLGHFYALSRLNWAGDNLG